MDQLVLTPSPAVDYNFDGASTPPFATAPATPKMSPEFPNFFYGEPTVPLINKEQTLNDQGEEEEEEEEVDFAFDFSGQLERSSVSDADELFHGGKIKPLEPPPPPPRRLNISNKYDQPRSPTLTPMFYDDKYSKHFSDEFHQTPGGQTQKPSPRGREKPTATTRHKTSRSLSPLRVSDILSDDQKVSSTNQSSSPFSFTWYNKWNLKNLLLFRSKSEGSATTSNDQLKKYAMITKSCHDVKNWSFRSSDGDGSVSRRRMKRKMSAHEIHYTANRAVAEEMKRKTFLPYKSGLLDCLGFSRNLNEISRGRR